MGIDIDDKLSFSNHVVSIASRISRCSGVIFRSSVYVNFSILRSLYFSLVYPYISYCVNVWGASSIGNSKRMSTTQNRILKLFKKLNPNSNQLEFQDLHKYSVAVSAYRYYVLKSSAYFHDKMLRLIPSHSHDTRHIDQNNLNLPSLRKALCQKQFFHQSIIIWNSLPLYIRRSPTLARFKKELKNFYLSGAQWSYWWDGEVVSTNIFTFFFYF